MIRLYRDVESRDIDGGGLPKTLTVQQFKEKLNKHKLEIENAHTRCKIAVVDLMTDTTNNRMVELLERIQKLADLAK